MITIKRIFEGRCGFNLTPAYEVYVGGELVGYSKRKWLAQAIGDAIVAGSIESTGDTTGRLALWAGDNDRALFDRICKAGE